MKNRVFSNLLLLSLLSLLLSACAGTSSGSASNADPSQPDSQTAASQVLSQPLQLAIGTLKLEDTSLSIDANQAAALLPLWQAYNSLSTSSTAAQVEVDAVLGQIEESMTAEQLKVIDDMQLTGASIGEVFQSLGLDTGFGRQGGFSGTPDPERLATLQASGGGLRSGRGGDFAPGTGPEGGRGGGFAPGGTPDPALLATRQAMAGGFAGGGRVNPALFQALIDLLQSKAAQ